MNDRYRRQLKLINRHFPFVGEPVSVNETGDDFLVFETGSGWMIRFPRNKSSAKALQREMKFLDRIREMTLIPVPNYEYAGVEFGAYRKIEGAPLSIELFESLRPATQQKIGRQLADFLSVVHNFPIDQAAELGIRSAWQGAHHDNGRTFLEHVAPLLSPEARRRAAGCMETALSFSFTPQVIHGDFYLPDHVFYDQRTEGLGVIDFADVTAYDAAHDLQCLLEVGGESFFDFVMKHYQGQADQALLERSKVRLAARPLFVAGYVFARGEESDYAGRLRQIESLFA